jgi:YD repeat-containing protein
MRVPTYDKLERVTQGLASKQPKYNWLLLSGLLTAFLWPGTQWAATATFAYDDLNRLTTATFDGSHIEYTYDSAGNIEKVLTPYVISITKPGNGFGTVVDDLGKLSCGDNCDGVYDLNALDSFQRQSHPEPGRFCTPIHN